MIEYGAIFIEFGALLIEHGALLIEHGALLINLPSSCRWKSSSISIEHSVQGVSI